MKRKREEQTSKNSDQSETPIKRQKFSLFENIRRHFFVTSESENRNTTLPIPNELLLKIMDLLSPRDLGNAAQVCREFNEISKDDMLWRKFALYQGYDKKVFEQIDYPVKHLVKYAAKKAKDLPKIPEMYGLLVDWMGGVDNIINLPVVQHENYDLEKHDLNLINELQGYKIWRGVGIIKRYMEVSYWNSGKQYISSGVHEWKQPYLAFCTKENDENGNSYLGLMLVFQNSKTHEIELKYNQRSSFFSFPRWASFKNTDCSELLRSLIADEPCESPCYFRWDLQTVRTLPDGKSYFELTDQSEFKDAAPSRCVIS